MFRLATHALRTKPYSSCCIGNRESPSTAVTREETIQLLNPIWMLVQTVEPVNNNNNNENL